VSIAGNRQAAAAAVSKRPRKCRSSPGVDVTVAGLENAGRGDDTVMGQSWATRARMHGAANA